MSLFGVSVSSRRRWAHVLAISSRIVLGCILAALGFLPGGAGAQVITKFITEFSAGISPLAEPFALAAGADGNLWFTEQYAGQIGRITPLGVVTEFSAPGGIISFAPGPRNITAGPDGNVWFATIDSQIGRITPGGGVVTMFNASAGAMTAGPDGNVWFTSNGAQIGRITPDGVVTEFSVGGFGWITTSITAGPDGNLWFTENPPFCHYQPCPGPPLHQKIGRITPEGVITEFSAGILGAQSITAGPDGNLWFIGDRIGRITPDGVVTQFSAGITAGASPYEITAGPDGNLWFLEIFDGNYVRVGRITPDGVVTEFSTGRLIFDAQQPQALTAGPDGNLWFTEYQPNRIGRITCCVVAGAGLSVDVHSGTGISSNLNGVFEAGETIQIEPGWVNMTVGSLALTGTAASLNGPPGATYSIDANFADYGMVAAGASANCYSATANCYRMSVSNPATRPALHWDATFLEALSTGRPATHVLHIGHSFPDVPDTNIMYRFVETLLHNEVTLGYGDGTFRPSDSSIRAHTLMFVARGMVAPNGDNALPASGSEIQPFRAPFNCIAGGISLFVDVQPTDIWCKHVHALAAGGVDVSYQCVDATHACLSNNTSRAAMAVFVADAIAGGENYVPCCSTPGSTRSYECGEGGNSHFPDVAPTDAHCRHVNYLWARGMIDGYPDGMFGPDDMVTRGQIAKFITNGFGLSLH